MKIKVYQSAEDKYIEMEVIGRYKYIGDSDELGCINGKVYNCVGIDEDGSLRIVDETDEDYLYNKDNFELVED
jgi:hypothetical protein